MTPLERKAAIAAHRAAHETKIAKRRAARIARATRNKRRGLAAAIKRMEQAQ
jgi:hypothetical protein